MAEYTEKELGQLAKKGKDHCQSLCEVIERRQADPKFASKHADYTAKMEQLKKLIDAL